jgi:fructose-bisphosphate aldolase, class I
MRRGVGTDIYSPEKRDAEPLLKEGLLEHLNRLGPGDLLMIKLSRADTDAFYSDLLDHSNVLRVVALSGGDSREEAGARLSRNPGIVASFSRALTTRLAVDQTDEEFDAVLESSIADIYAASLE